MALYRQNGDREGQRWDRVRGWGIQGRVWDPVEEEVTNLGDGRELFVVECSRNVFYAIRHKFDRMDYAVGGGHGKLGLCL